MRFVQDDDELPDPGPPPVLRPFEPEELDDLRERLEQVPEEVRHYVRELREGLGWSQARLARELADLGMQLDATAITRIESGKRGVRIEEAWALAAALRTELDGLVPTLTTVMSLEDRIRYAEERLAQWRRRAERDQKEIADEEAEIARLRELLEKQRKAEA